MRRRRGEMIEQFVDRLPIRRRRRPAPRASDEEEEEEEAAVRLSPEEDFAREVRRAIAEVIRLLQDELTVSARQMEFFNFTVNFYEVMQRLDLLGDITESAIRRWVMYFFVTEHIATTLNYLHNALRVYPAATRHLDLGLAQVVMRARDAQGENIYTRVWNETGVGAFQALMRRIAVDLSATVERAGRGELDEAEREEFMADIAYHDNSGDVEEILRQVAMNDALIDSVELSFRFRVTGPVVFSQNRQIQTINRRVVALTTQLRRQHQPLPELNQQGVQLPPP